MSKDVRRLFNSFRPSNYKLTLEAEREQKRVTGTVVITGQKMGRPSQRLTFHQKGLRVHSATIVRHDKKHGEQTIEVARINAHQKLEEVRLHAGQLLYAGPYTVTITFTAPIQDSMHGIYACNYEVDGQRKQLVATQFESHYAREAFPCIDEPEAKATFDLSMQTPAGETVLSNTLPARETEAAGIKTTVFETTPKMSTYLLAFAFGDIHSREATTDSGVLVRIWATRAHRPEALDFALDVATRGITFFSDYYGVPYPLKKCDHIALPDFSVGAMENWGLITYRESCLLADPDTTSQSGRERVATVITHELSHQWFGNLVTMRWWNDLWLNESFANVMEYEAADALFPDWHIWDGFKSGEGLSAIRRDSIAGVQAIQVDVHHPDEISTIFDPSIVYAKGGRLLNMLKHYLGETQFRAGLKQYFEAHAYGNTTGSDLWSALSAASGTDVAALMNPWLERSGFPALSVSQRGDAVTISQAHFLLDASKADPERIWPIPLRASTDALPALLDTRTLEATLPAADYVRLNQGAIGHYVVQYTEPGHAAAMAKLVAEQKLEPSERLMLLHDSSLLARGGAGSFADTLRLLDHYAAETSEPVWDVMSLVLADARRFIDADEALEQRVKALVRSLIPSLYNRLGWKERKGEHVDDTKLRATIIGLGAYAGQEDIVKHALELFAAYRQDPAAVPSELRAIVFGVAIRTAAPGAFAYLLQLHEHTTDVHLRDDALGALTITRSPQQAEQLLARVPDPAQVKPQDADTWVLLLLRNRHTRQTAWQWLQANWNWVERTFQDDQTYDHWPRYIASAFNTRQYLQEYDAFFEPKSSQTALTRNIALGIEEIENRAAWIERDLADVQAYFKDRPL